MSEPNGGRIPLQRSRRILAAVITLAAVAGFGCGGGSGGAGPITVPSEDYGGYVYLFVNEDGVIAWSAFYTDVSPSDEIEFFRFPNDRCVVSEGDPTTVYSYLDVGPSVTVDGVVDMTLTRKIEDSRLFYEWVDFTSTYPVGTSYTAAITGTGSTPAFTLGTIRVPNDFDLISTDLYVIPDIVNYTPNVGADAVRLYIEGPYGKGTCFVEDDGQFDVPAEFLEQVGIPATVRAFAWNIDFVSYNGKTVVLHGVTN